MKDAPVASLSGMEHATGAFGLLEAELPGLVDRNSFSAAGWAATLAGSWQIGERAGVVHGDGDGG